jgi:hypothetical protein
MLHLKYYCFHLLDFCSELCLVKLEFASRFPEIEDSYTNALGIGVMEVSLEIAGGSNISIFSTPMSRRGSNLISGYWNSPKFADLVCPSPVSPPINYPASI